MATTKMSSNILLILNIIYELKYKNTGAKIATNFSEIRKDAKSERSIPSLLPSSWNDLVIANFKVRYVALIRY